jgi:fatty acid amide hydrolase
MVAPSSQHLYALPATELRQLLNSGQTSSVEIVQALIARSQQVDGKVRAFVLRFDQEALRLAAQADAERKRGEAHGLLHGLPVSIKENIDIAGTDSTMGIVPRRNTPAQTDAITVRVLRQQGAIALGKTNIPQLLLAQESENAIWGITHNPWHSGRSPGGSSGGEAAAIASGQSPFGIGTDIGGSIRIPAHFCGIFGLKPTVDRWSNRGSATSIPGQELVRAQMGPMARTATDLALLMEAVDPRLAAQMDPAVPPFAIGDPASLDLKGLRVGVFVDDGFLAPNPAIARGVKLAADALRAAGATVVDYTPPQPDLMYTWLAGISADGGKTLEVTLQGDDPVRQLKTTFRLARLPTPVRMALAKVLALRGDHRLARLLSVLGEKPLAEFWRLTNARTVLRRQEFDAWATQGLDAVICPPHSLPAMPLGTSGDLTLSLSYAFRYVMLNYPAGIAPVTRVRAGEDQRAVVRDTLDKKCAAAEAGSVGLPVGVQVVAKPYREDLVLALLAAIEHGVRDAQDYPVTPVDPQG